MSVWNFKLGKLNRIKCRGIVTDHGKISPPRTVVDFLSLWIHSLDAIWRIGSSPTQHQYQQYTGLSNDPFWLDTQGTEVQGSYAIDFNKDRISSSVPKALIMKKVLITSAQMNGGRVMCNTVE